MKKKKKNSNLPCGNSTEKKKKKKISGTYNIKCLASPLNPPSIWEDITQLECDSWRFNSLKGLLCRLVLGSAGYNIWRTRNEIRHAGHPCTEEQILKNILWEVCAKVVGKGKFPKIRENMVLSLLMQVAEGSCASGSRLQYSLLLVLLFCFCFFFFFLFIEAFV
jgi:hypothetical protein